MSSSRNCRACARDLALDLVVANGGERRRRLRHHPEDLRRALQGRRRLHHHRQPCLGPEGDDRLHRQRSQALAPDQLPRRHAGQGQRHLSDPARQESHGRQHHGAAVHDPLDDPFQAAEQLLRAHKLGGNVDAILIDFHGEATSEKMAMGTLPRWQGVAGGRHPHPCPDRGPPDPARRHGLSDRCRDVRRLRFGDRHGEGDPDRPPSPRRCRPSGSPPRAVRERSAASMSRPMTSPALPGRSSPSASGASCRRPSRRPRRKRRHDACRPEAAG